MIKHTPGPWKIGAPQHPPNNADWFSISSETGSPIAWINADQINRPDIRLIAAAPDLLDALKRLMQWEYERSSPSCSFDSLSCGCDIHQAHQAIKKAEAK